MLEIRQIKDFDKDLLPKFVQLFESAFPIDERRKTEQLLQIINRGDCVCYTIFYENQFAGFLTEWHFESFRYCEYFAIESDLRGKNIGTNALKIVQNLSMKPLILEVEPPTDAQSRRRIEFYKRNAFSLCDKPYMQPAYTPTSKAIPLLLMEFGGNLTQTNFDEIVQEIHTKVYRKPTL